MQGIIDMFTLANGEPDLCLILSWIVSIASIVFNMYLIHDAMRMDDLMKIQEGIIAELNDQINDLTRNSKVWH